MTDELWKNLIGVVIALFTAANTTILWSIRDKVLTHNQSLYGEDGDNGLRGDVKLLRAARHAADTLLTAHTFQLDDHRQAIADLKAKAP